MTKKVYYEKVGCRYVPVAEYDSDLLAGFPEGNHLVMCYPGGQSRRFNIDPDYASMIAASRVAQDAMCRAISKASELRPSHPAITEGQSKAWRKLSKEFGDELCTLQGPSAHDIAEAGIKALQAEADVLYLNPAVRKAYDHYILLCKLTKEETNAT